MRHVITENRWAPARPGASFVTLADDAAVVPEQAWASALIWNPELPGPRSTCSWDLLGSIADAADADRIAEHLFSVIKDEASLFYVPEAALLTANLLLAAVRGRRTLHDVLEWAATGDLTEPYRYLLLRGETGPAADLTAFAAASPAERTAIWDVLRRAVLPLDDGVVLMDLSDDPRATRLPAPFGMLRCRLQQPTAPRLFVLAAPGSRSAGVAAALEAEVLIAAAMSSSPVRVDDLHPRRQG